MPNSHIGEDFHKAIGGKAQGDSDFLSCGLVMPISSIDGCSAEHWLEVKDIVTDAVQGIRELKFSVKLVSDADAVGVIQKRIVQNVYTSDVVVCDVSGKNPNVMFELGMRLAFDKPTVIIKDDKTDYSFDTGIIEHVGYPRDLRFARMMTFKSVLADKVLATHKAAKADPDHSTFLKNFGKFHVANLKEDVIPAERALFEMMSEIQGEMVRLRRSLRDQEIGRSDRLKISGRTRVAQILVQYLAENPNANILELLDNSAFLEEMEKRCAAPMHFSGPAEFKEALDDAARHITTTHSQLKY